MNGDDHTSAIPQPSTIPPRPRPSRSLRWCTITLMTLELGSAVALVSVGVMLWDPARAFTFFSFALAVAPAAVLLVCAYVQFRAVFRRRLQASVWAAVIELMAGVGSLMAAAFFWASRGPDPSELIAVIIAVVLGPFFIFAMAQTLRWSNRLAEYHTFKPYCGPCGYNLIGTIAAGASQCPECGAEIPYEKLSRYRGPR